MCTSHIYGEGEVKCFNSKIKTPEGNFVNKRTGLFIRLAFFRFTPDDLNLLEERLWPAKGLKRRNVSWIRCAAY